MYEIVQLQNNLFYRYSVKALSQKLKRHLDIFVETFLTPDIFIEKSNTCSRLANISINYTLILKLSKSRLLSSSKLKKKQHAQGELL